MNREDDPAKVVAMIEALFLGGSEPERAAA
jgi:hypothetical protein